MRDAAEWWRGAAIYQIYPRSFADSNGDGIGDLAGITAHLDHVAALGVDAIWISPFFTSPQRDFGYDVADYRGVDPDFGTLADFDALVVRAHALGLKVIVDQVWAHTSDQHDWFRASRTARTGAHADWYVWADAKPDGTPPNNWQSVFGGPAWTWDARRGQYYLHTFLKEQPQLNLRAAAVQDALLDSARFWLDRGVDGFRLDAINHGIVDAALRDNPVRAADGVVRTRPYDFQDQVHTINQPEMLPFLERIRDLLDGYGARFTVAEVGGPHSAIVRQIYTAPGRLDTAYGFDFLYAPALTPALVRGALESWRDGPDTGWPSWAFENHDAPRAVSRWAAPADRDAFARMKMMLLACLRGSIFVYQGEELGLPQVDIAFEDLRDPEAIANWPLTLSRDGARTPMPWRADAPALGFTTGTPWLPLGAEHAALAVDVQAREPASLLHWTKAMIALRKAHPALRLGGIAFLETSGNVLAFERTVGAERLICAFNLGAEAATFTHRYGGVLASTGDIAGQRLGGYAALVARA